MKSTSFTVSLRTLRISQAGIKPLRPLTSTLSRNTLQIQIQPPQRQFTTAIPKMSFSNADTGSKDADPYTKKNQDVDASIKEKVEDLSEFISSCKFGMMTTRDSEDMLVSRCMAVAAKENDGIDLLFHTNTESGKTDDLQTDKHINISFLNGSGEWASVSGTAAIITDRDVVRKYYKPTLKAWLGDLGDGKHDGGPEDPRIGVIKVTTNTATYAIIRKNMAARAMEIAQGTITGSTAQVNKLREISAEEVKTWRSSSKMVS